MYKVLIVDDEILTRKALSTIVAGMSDFEIAASLENGEDALAYCRNHEVHIVFLDIALPGITGIETAAGISSIIPTAQIFIVSALSGFEIIKKTLSSNIRDYIVKPVSYGEISNLLNKFLNDRKEDMDLASRIFSYIHQHEYREMMDSVPGLVSDIFQGGKGGTERILDRFLQILDHILEKTSPDSSESGNLSGKDLAAQFPVNRVFAEEEVSWVFWFSDVLNALYWQQVIDKHEFLKQISEYIDSEIKNDISLSSICDACSISQSYLSKLFRKNFGISVMDYIHLRKMNKAKMYIALTDYTMTQIGYHTGYNDGSYFSKIFKKYEGMTPKQYRTAYNVRRTKGEKV